MTRRVLTRLECLETAVAVAARPKRIWEVAIVGANQEVLKTFSFEEGCGAGLPVDLSPQPCEP